MCSSDLAKFAEWTLAQGAKTDITNDSSALPTAKFSRGVAATADGYIAAMDAELIGKAAMVLGAGRAKKDDEIDYGAGIVLAKKTPDEIHCGDILATLYTSEDSRLDEAEQLFRKALTVSDEKPEESPLIYKFI